MLQVFLTIFNRFYVLPFGTTLETACAAFEEDTLTLIALKTKYVMLYLEAFLAQVDYQFLFRGKLKRSTGRETSSANFVCTDLLELVFLCLRQPKLQRNDINGIHQWLLVLTLTSGSKVSSHWVML